MFSISCACVLFVIEELVEESAIPFIYSCRHIEIDILDTKM